MPVLPRLLGVATTAIGALELAKPDLWSRPTGITGPSAAMRAWHHTVGARDVVSGPALLLGPAGGPLRAALLFRIVSDITDAVGAGINAPVAAGRAKAAGAALGYAALNAVALRGNRR